MHKKKVEEHETRNSLSLASSATSLILSNMNTLEAENKAEQKKIKLEDKVK